MQLHRGTSYIIRTQEIPQYQYDTIVNILQWDVAVLW